MHNDSKIVSKYLPALVNENMAEFLKHRRLELVSGSVSKRKAQKVVTHNDLLDSETFTKAIQVDEYVILEAKDLATKDRRYRKQIAEINQKKITKTYIVILDVNSKYGLQSPEFITLMKRIPQFDQEKRDHNIDIIIISQYALSSHIQKKIDMYRSFGTPECGFTNFEDYQYHVFLSNIMDPNHSFVPPHRLLSREEETELLKNIHAEKKDLPRIHQSDPPIVWIGGEIGDIVEIKQYSESTGEVLQYRVVIPPRRII